MIAVSGNYMLRGAKCSETEVLALTEEERTLTVSGNIEPRILNLRTNEGK